MTKLEQEQVAWIVTDEGQLHSAATWEWHTQKSRMGDTCACVASWPNAGSEVHSLDLDYPETASFRSALATNPAMAQLDTGWAW